MKCLLTAAYFSHDTPPLVTIVAESDLADTIEASKQKLLDLRDDGFLVFYEIEAESVEAVGMANGAPDRDPQREQNMAILYFWTARLFGISRAIATKDPAPLNADEIEAVLAQMPRHSAWNDNTVLSHGEDSILVTLNPDGSTERTPINE